MFVTLLMKDNNVSTKNKRTKRRNKNDQAMHQVNMLI